RPGTVEIRHLAACAARKLLMDHSAKRCHTDTAADEDHLALSRLDVEFSIRAGHVDAIAQFQPEEVRRDDARWDHRCAPCRRHCQADIVNQTATVLRSPRK